MENNNSLNNNQGKKFDEAKIRYDLLPLGAVNQLAAVLTYGAGKYGERNWDQGIEFNRLYAAAQRHLQAWFAGEDLDPESGLSHLAHAMFGVSALLEFVLRAQLSLDNRPKDHARAMPMVLSADNSRIDPEISITLCRACKRCGGSSLSFMRHPKHSKLCRMACDDCDLTTAWVRGSSETATRLWNATCGCPAPVPGTPSPMDENDCGLEEKGDCND